jgi:phage shock protein A
MPHRPAENPLDALARVERLARNAKKALERGESINGASTLAKIAEYAGDVRRHHAEDAAARSHEDT